MSVKTHRAIQLKKKTRAATGNTVTEGWKKGTEQKRRGSVCSKIEIVLCLRKWWLELVVAAIVDLL